jgi:acyl dehydratase
VTSSGSEQREYATGDVISAPLLVDVQGAPRPLTRSDLARYAGASGDFNPMHTDEVAAQAAGQPSVFGHGMFTAGLMARVITDAFGADAVRTYAMRFTRQTWPDEVLTATLTVVGETREGDQRVLSLIGEVTNAVGERKLLAEITVAS